MPGRAKLCGQAWVGVEYLAQEGLQLRHFRCRKRCREFSLHRVGGGLKLIEVSPAERGDRDGVAASVGRVCRALNLAAVVEPGHDPVDGIAVQTELSAEICLADLAMLFQCGQNGEVGTPCHRHPRSREPRTQDVHPIGLPADQGPQPSGWGYCLVVRHSTMLTVVPNNE